MKPRKNRVKTNRLKTKRRVYRKKSKTRKRRGGTCEDTNARAFAYTTQFLYDK
jgi:hypothetical protein